MTLAAIFGCQGPVLTVAERDFFRSVNPLGFILFSRNIEDRPQIKRLTAGLRDCVGRADVPILVDQEGGRVARLRPPLARAYPPAARHGNMYRHNPDHARRAAFLHGYLMGRDLHDLGINVDCAPVADLRIKDAHAVIGDRAFSDDPAIVADLASHMARGLRGAGIIPVLKHLPGHGRASVDSHLELPGVDADLQTLDRTDFSAFRIKAWRGWGMTAHVVYEAIDKMAPATTSERIIRSIIRGALGFEGFLISDDLSMKALSGDFAERTVRSLEAGCDTVLHCNGDMGEMEWIAAAARSLTEEAQNRLAAGKVDDTEIALGKDQAMVEKEWDALMPRLMGQDII